VTALADDVLAAVRRVRRGTAVSYAWVAEEIGRPGAARAVGRVLSHSGGEVPWWRVVAADGRLVPGHEAAHRRLLEREGVEVVDGRTARRPMHR
jgi:alkylated DNA nucleotide flippase Atl1